MSTYFRSAAVVFLASAAGSAAGQFDSFVVEERVFNDFAGSTLNVTNDFPNELTFSESDFGSGNFANRHMAYLSDDGGATAFDFDYDDGLDFSVTMNLDASPVDGREAGIVTDLFGFGFFGALPNGEIAAFGSFLPFHSFGVGVYTNGTDVDLRMIYTPGAGEGLLPASTIEYIIDTGSGPISSGVKVFDNLEGGIPTDFNARIGLGAQFQGNPGGSATATFTNIVAIPAPATAATAMLGLAAMGRRRR
ncbi:MAG: hypothetical protein AAGF47_07740 [Planctomycetota bacterium]